MIPCLENTVSHLSMKCYIVWGEYQQQQGYYQLLWHGVKISSKVILIILFNMYSTYVSNYTNDQFNFSSKLVNTSILFCLIHSRSQFMNEKRKRCGVQSLPDSMCRTSHTGLPWRDHLQSDHLQSLGVQLSLPYIRGLR